MRRLPIWLVCMVGVGCYSPSVPHGVACAPGVGADRCPAGQVCVVRGGIEVCEPAGSTGDPGPIDAAVDTSGPVDAVDAFVAPGIDAPDGGAPVGWWNLAWSHRRPIDVTAGTNGMPAGYSLAITLDHASLVGSGQSLASGNDVRIVRDNGPEIDRVLDTGAAWNTATTKLWFRNQTALAAGATVRLWVYYGNASPGTPAATPASVFLLSDDFESGLGQWDIDTGVTASTTRAHRGTHSVQIGVNNQTDVGLSAMAINETNIAFDAWWNLDTLTDVDISQGVRANGTSAYYTDFQGTAPTFDISKNEGGYMELVPPPSGATTPAANTWFRVTVYAYGDQMAVDYGSARYVPTAGTSTIGAVTTGTVFLYTYVVTQHVWWDDTTVRRFVLPEPVVTVGAVQTWP